MELGRKVLATGVKAALVAAVVVGGVYVGSRWMGVWGALLGVRAAGWLKDVGGYGWLPTLLVMGGLWWLSERKKRLRERRQWMEPMYRALVKHLEHMEGIGGMWGPLWTELKEEVEKAGHFCKKREWTYLQGVLEGSRKYQGGEGKAREGKEWAKEQKRRGRSVFGWLVRL